jgi:hypothetical protein
LFKILHMTFASGNPDYLYYVVNMHRHKEKSKLNNSLILRSAELLEQGYIFQFHRLWARQV